MKLELDLHDIYNRSGEIDRALRDVLNEAVRIKALHHRVEKASDNFGRVFVHFRWK